ncbi:MAG: shikimate dehydrogenase [Phycisphaerae bacterium]
MTLLAVPIFGESLDQIRNELRTAVRLGADLIELRLDLMPTITDDDVRTLCEEPHGDVLKLLTIRSASEGGQWSGIEGERVARLVSIGPLFDYVDVELAAWRSLTEADRAALSAAPRRGLVLSRHDCRGRPATLEADLLRMLETTDCRVPKLAWSARTIRDSFEAFELMRLAAPGGGSPAGKPGILICMGDAGMMSRVLAKKFGAFATFAALGAGRESAAGQITISDLKNRYRWDRIDTHTKVFGIIGDPVVHSLSPQVHNAAFEKTGLNAVYLPLHVSDSYEAFKAFLVEVLARPWLAFRGFSVTMPHKENALRFLRETGGSVDPIATGVGAVNTLNLESDGSIAGHNTDYEGALSAITSGLNRADRALAGLKVAVLGAGGAARAVVAALTDHGARVTVFNRTEEKGAALAAEFGCAHAPWIDRPGSAAELIVNCTSLGLGPETEASPLEDEGLRPGVTVFDTIYNPTRTRLLRMAEQRNCGTIDGLTMFSAQARAQFKAWTGRDLPADFFRNAALEGAAEPQGRRHTVD